MFRRRSRPEAVAPAPPVKRSRALRIADWTGRLLLIVATVWLATTTLATFTRLQASRSGPEFEEAGELSSTVATPPHEFVLADLLDSGWTLAGLPVEVAIRTVSPEELDRRLTAVEERSPTVDASVTKSFDIAALLKGLGARSRTVGQFTVQELNQPGMRAAAIGRMVNGKQQLSVVRLAWQLESDQWSLLEARAASREALEHSANERLLPLADGASSIAQRRDAQGRLIGEVLSTGNVAEQLSAWRDDGYQLAPAPGSSGEAKQYLCSRGDEMIHVWAQSEPDKRGGVLLLVRAPRE